MNKQVAFTEHINMRPFMSDKEVNIRERERERERERCRERWLCTLDYTSTINILLKIPQP